MNDDEKLLFIHKKVNTGASKHPFDPSTAHFYVQPRSFHKAMRRLFSVHSPSIAVTCLLQICFSEVCFNDERERILYTYHYKS